MIAMILGLVGSTQEAWSQSDYLRESEKKARVLLDKVVEAMGGEAYLRMEDIQRMGEFYSFRRDQLQGRGSFQSFEKFPFKLRFELGKKGEIVNINDGDQGWKIEYKVVKEQTAEEIQNYRKDRNHSLDYILKVRLKEKGMKFRYLGKSRLDLSEVEGVQLIDADNDRVKIFIDTASFLPAKIEFKAPAFGKRWSSDDERLYYNYHTVEGVQVPFSTTRFSNGYKASEFHLKSVAVNQSLPDALFTPNFKK